MLLSSLNFLVILGLDILVVLEFSWQKLSLGIFRFWHFQDQPVCHTLFIFYVRNSFVQFTLNVSITMFIQFNFGYVQGIQPKVSSRTTFKTYMAIAMVWTDLGTYAVGFWSSCYSLIHSIIYSVGIQLSINKDRIKGHSVLPYSNHKC